MIASALRAPDIASKRVLSCGRGSAPGIALEVVLEVVSSRPQTIEACGRSTKPKCRQHVVVSRSVGVRARHSTRSFRRLQPHRVCGAPVLRVECGATAALPHAAVIDACAHHDSSYRPHFLHEELMSGHGGADSSRSPHGSGSQSGRVDDASEHSRPTRRVGGAGQQLTDAVVRCAQPARLHFAMVA